MQKQIFTNMDYYITMTYRLNSHTNIDKPTPTHKLTYRNTQAHAQTYTHTHDEHWISIKCDISWWVIYNFLSLCVFVCVYVSVWLCVCFCVFVWVFVFVYVCVCDCVWVCVCVCVTQSLTVLIEDGQESLARLILFLSF